MEALERWAGHYPELQPLASLPKALDALEAGVRRLGDPAEAPDPGEVRAGVGMEVAELQELLASLRPSAERLRTQLAKGPLSSLTALNLQLQSELQRGPGLPGGQALCEGLREVLDGAGCSAAPALDDALERRAQEYLREPLERLLEHSRRHDAERRGEAGGLTGPARKAVQQIQELSAQIVQRTFRSDRLELMDSRSLLVQQLLGSLEARQRTGGEVHELLAGRLQAFEEEHSGSTQACQAEVQHHSAVTETLDRNLESVASYLREKERAREVEDQATAEQQQRRFERVSKVVQTMQEACETILEIAEEGRRDRMQLLRAELEEQVARQVCEDIGASLRQCRDVHDAASQHLQESLQLERQFADWLRAAHQFMREKVAQIDAETAQGRLTDRARMLVLSRAAVEQLRTQRLQVQQALGRTRQKITARQDAMLVMELERPSGEDIAQGLRQLRQVQESARWQEREVEALAAIEQRMSREGTPGDAADQLGRPADLVDEDEWDRLVREAEEWVSGFFYTWKFATPACEQSPSGRTPSEAAPPPGSGGRGGPYDVEDVRRALQEWDPWPTTPLMEAEAAALAASLQQEASASEQTLAQSPDRPRRRVSGSFRLAAPSACDSADAAGTAQRARSWGSAARLPQPAGHGRLLAEVEEDVVLRAHHSRLRINLSPVLSLEESPDPLAASANTQLPVSSSAAASTSISTTTPVAAPAPGRPLTLSLQAPPGSGRALAAPPQPAASARSARASLPVALAVGGSCAPVPLGSSAAPPPSAATSVGPLAPGRVRSARQPLSCSPRPVHLAAPAQMAPQGARPANPVEAAGRHERPARHEPLAGPAAHAPAGAGHERRLAARPLGAPAVQRMASGALPPEGPATVVARAPQAASSRPSAPALVAALPGATPRVPPGAAVARASSTGALIR